MGKFPPKLVKLCLTGNDLKDDCVNEFPVNLEYLELVKNEITTFEGDKFLELKKLDLRFNKLSKFTFPPNIIALNISDNYIENLPDFPQKIERLYCSSNLLNVLPTTNKNLKQIDFSNNKIDKFPEFFDDVDHIEGYDNFITDIDKLPSGLEYLDLSNNKLTSLSNICLPPSLINLNLSDNLLLDMPDLPTEIEEVDLTENRIKELKTVPASVKILKLKKNEVEIPDELKRRSDIELEYDDNDDDDIDCESLWYSDSRRDTYRNYPRHYSYNDDDYHRYNDDDYHRRSHYGSSRYQNYSNITSYFSSHSERYRQDTPDLRSNSKTKKDNPNYISCDYKKHVVV
jgi:Leucine-rich repeat (LRR) protein